MDVLIFSVEDNNNDSTNNRSTPKKTYEGNDNDNNKDNGNYHNSIKSKSNTVKVSEYCPPPPSQLTSCIVIRLQVSLSIARFGLVGVVDNVALRVVVTDRLDTRRSSLTETSRCSKSSKRSANT